MPKMSAKSLRRGSTVVTLQRISEEDPALRSVRITTFPGRMYNKKRKGIDYEKD